MSRTVLVLMAVGAAVIAAALGFAWHGKRSDQAAMAAMPAASASPVSVPGTSRPTPSAAPAEGKQVAVAAPPAGAPALTPVPGATQPTAPAAALVPSFDVARIGPDGRAVIAGRAAPNAKVVLLDGGKEIARGEADARGEWVILLQDPPLTAGHHELRAVHHIEGRAPVTSEQVVVAVVPAPAASSPGGPSGSVQGTAKQDGTLVLVSPVTGPTTLIQPASPAGTPRSGDLQKSTMDYDQHGQTTITGQAAPGATVRAYVDDKVVAESTAGSDGRWKLTPAEPIDSGPHRLRLDRLAQDGKPIARLEMPFERLALAPVAGDNARRLHVVRGDTLWNIARAHYGQGWRYTMIFDANKEQIRDPHRIYPGQVFSVPKAN